MARRSQTIPTTRGARRISACFSLRARNNTKNARLNVTWCKKADFQRQLPFDLHSQSFMFDLRRHWLDPNERFVDPPVLNERESKNLFMFGDVRTRTKFYFLCGLCKNWYHLHYYEWYRWLWLLWIPLAFVNSFSSTQPSAALTNF